MASVNTRGFNLRQFPVAPRLNYRPIDTLSGMGRGLARGFAGMADRRDERQAEAEAEEEQERLKDIQTAAIKLSEFDDIEEKKSYLDSLELDDESKILATQMGKKISLDNELSELGLTAKRAQVRGIEAEALANRLRTMDNLDEAVNGLSEEEQALLPQAQEILRRRKMDQLVEDLKLQKLFNEVNAAEDEKVVFGSPEEAEQFYGRKVRTKPFKRGDQSGVVVTSIDDEEFKETESLYPFEVNTPERPFFTIASKLNLFPAEGESKKDFQKRIGDQVRKYSENLDIFEQLLLRGGGMGPISGGQLGTNIGSNEETGGTQGGASPTFKFVDGEWVQTSE